MGDQRRIKSAFDLPFCFEKTGMQFASCVLQFRLRFTVLTLLS